MKNEIYTLLIQFLGPLIMGGLGWITTRAQARVKAFFDDIEKRDRELRILREDLGKQKQINEALWRNIDNLKEELNKNYTR